ncbi:ACR3 family arsenite efflux transporter [Methylothermus subterraneus]
MSWFERLLSLWVLLCIGVGLALGQAFPEWFHTLGRLEVAHINLPVAVLIWLMIFPMLLKIDFREIWGVRRHWRGVGATLFVNWLVKPFSMAALAWLFLEVWFRPWLPAEQIASYRAGLIILAAAPCTAMVFVWSHLMRGEPHFTLSQVALNDLIMIFAFAPLVGGLLGIANVHVPWDTLFLAVLLYLVVPLALALGVRRILLSQAHGYLRLRRVLKLLGPISILALLLTLVVLFGFQGEQVLRQPRVIALLAVPITVQVFGNSGLAYLLNLWLRSPHCVAGPSALIGASNFFELAVATAISLFGFDSGAALATVVGVLIEVPVMLLAVRLVNATRNLYERRKGVVPYAECCPTGLHLHSE